MQFTLQRKLAILADAAKYDASGASSGRCISLLKVLTNFCIYDCAYCINRSSPGS